MSVLSGQHLFDRDVPRFLESPAGVLPPYPRRTWLRWAMRGVLALPLIVVVVRYALLAPEPWHDTANQALLPRVRDGAGASDFSQLLTTFSPPLGALPALVLPSELLLALGGALLGGFFLQGLDQAMFRRGLHGIIRLVVLVSLLISPVFALLAATDITMFGAVVLFGFGLIDIVRFENLANTQAGFRAGLLLGAAAMTDVRAIPLVLTVAIAGTLLIHSRPKARAANAVIVAFPTVAVTVALALAGVIIGSGPLTFLRTDATSAARAIEALVSDPLSEPLMLYLAPVLVVAITAGVFGFARSGVMMLLIAVGALAGVLVGSPLIAAAALAYLLVHISVTILPTESPAQHAAIVVMCSVLVGIVGWVVASRLPEAQEWSVVFTGFGSVPSGGGDG